MKILTCFIIIICAFKIAHGQRVIAVQNPTFQRELLWYSCNFMQYQQPEDQNSIASNGNSKKANKKESGNEQEKQLLNIVDYTNVAFEGISQKLIKPMIRNKTYLFTFYAARDSGYAFNTEAKKKQPLKLYIFGSEANCGFGELLAPPFKISNSKWTKYSMPIKASKANWTHMVIYAALDSATDEKEKASESFLLFNQQGPLVLNYRNVRVSKSGYDPGVFSMESYSKLSYGGILMMYEVSPKSIHIFDKDGEIMQEDSIRKDIDRNRNLDSMLNKFRGIDYLFIIMKEKKYNTKRLNIISYLKTKYPEILPHAKITRYSTLISKRKNKSSAKDLQKYKDEIGDLLILEQVRTVEKEVKK